MTPLAEAMLYLFIAIWIAAMITWIIGMVHFLPVWWALLRRRRPERRHVRGSVFAAIGFILLFGAGFAVGGIAELAGGWG